MSKRAWLTLAMVSVTVGLLAVVLGAVDLAGVRRALADVSLPGLAALTAFSLSVWLLMPTWRWWAILETLGVTAPFWTLLRVKAGAQPVKLVVPLRGGEAVRAVWLRQNLGVPLATGAASVVFDMGLVALGQLGLAAVAFAVLGERGLWVTAGLTALAALGLGSTRLHSVGLGLLRRVSGRFAEKLLPVAAALSACSPRRKLGLAVLTLLTELPEIVSLWGALRLAGAPVPLEAVAVGLPLVVVAGLLPISIAGFGTREFAITTVFARWAPPETVAAGALLFSAIEFVLPAIVGLVATPRVLGELAETPLNGASP